MTICYFGNFNPDYPRNRIIIKGLEQNGVRVVYSLRVPHDLVIVGYSDARWPVIVAKLLSRKPIVWDAFYSLYDAWVFDRKLVSPRSLKAKLYWFLDWLGCKLADRILLDTNAHIDYFVKQFIVRQNKFIRVFVGTDPDLFFPQQNRATRQSFLVHFHGNFIPLQGTQYIVQAAEMLRHEDIHFQIIGRGQDYQEVRDYARQKNLTNITWIDKVPYASLSTYIGAADVCLGGFGSSEKSNYVSMNKLFEYMACGKAVITGDSAAAHELLQDSETAMFCKRADPADLANKILFLKKNPKIVNTLGNNARQLFLQSYTPQLVVNELLTLFNHG